ncbi:hypothetical protein KY362_04260 [Candidatus Woesearchaeota archaeon]|nr:hypothetical protein [Candidatus Woesearchaeota archaeon]
MIGKPKWFKRRKYGGWGIMPKTWQGYVYLAAVLLPFIIFQSLPYWSDTVRIYVSVGWLAFLLLDVNHIMIAMRKDEFEARAEAFAERNAAWVMVLVLAVGIVYQLISSSLEGSPEVDVFLAVALIGGVVAKAASNIYFDRRGLK